ncbi:MAG: SOS response-associated peptidase family protein [Alphaproteobacteria bacterium]|nr:SOS response-associated peptidase family protein [Alphaproteobacteria bacterium]
MCGKFTQMMSWQAVHDYSDFLGASDGPETVTPMRFASVLCRTDEGQREVKRMRWGFARRTVKDPTERPEHIHARAETTDTKPTFRKDGKSLGIAVLWEGWINQNEDKLLTFVMVRVAANRLIGTITDRMPAVIQPAD